MEHPSQCPTLSPGVRYALVCATHDVSTARDLINDEGVYQPQDGPASPTTMTFQRRDGSFATYYSYRYPMVIAWVDLPDPL